VIRRLRRVAELPRSTHSGAPFVLCRARADRLGDRVISLVRHTHKHDHINPWLTKNPRITLHFTPTSGSWLNLVEVFFSIITRQAIRRGSFDSVKDLTTAIRRFIDGYNDRCQPFLWTKTPEEILPRAT